MDSERDDGMQEKEHVKRVWLLGPESRAKQTLLKCLQQNDAPACREFICALHADNVMPEDAALLFPFSDSKDGAEAWRSFEEFSEVLEQILLRRPGRILLISDTMVYGKLFGRPRRLREDELGYVGHTAPGDIAAHCLRTAEHLGFRLAREEGLNLKIVRVRLEDVPAGEECGTQAGGAGKMTELLLDILENGEPGEVYNLPSASGKDQAEGFRETRQRSPLSPLEVTTDTGKAEKNAALRAAE